MRLAFVTDIHSRPDLLEQVLCDIREKGVGQVYSLGDNVGYGPDPSGVLRLLRENEIPAILGNHELALLDRDYRKRFRGEAGRAIDRNARRLNRAELDEIAGFPFYRVVEGARLVHGLPPDSVTDYLVKAPDERLVRLMTLLPQQISFVGHTHLLAVAALIKGRLVRSVMKKSALSLDKEGRYIINAGSVGQPRDGTPGSTYVIWDTGSNHVTPCQTTPAG